MMWVSVDDALPVLGMHCLVCRGDKLNVAVLTARPAGVMWFTVGKSLVQLAGVVKPTHWIYIIFPVEGGSDELV